MKSKIGIALFLMTAVCGQAGEIRFNDIFQKARKGDEASMKYILELAPQYLSNEKGEEHFNYLWAVTGLFEAGDEKMARQISQLPNPTILLLKEHLLPLVIGFQKRNPQYSFPLTEKILASAREKNPKNRTNPSSKPR